MPVGGGVRGGYVGEACASNKQTLMGDGWLWARVEGSKHPKRGKVRVVRRIVGDSLQRNATKDRPEERSDPASGMKSQGVDFFCEGGR